MTFDDQAAPYREIVDQYRRENDQLRNTLLRREQTITKMRALIGTLLDNDPNELAADGGVTVLDVWRKDAMRVLE